MKRCITCAISKGSSIDTPVLFYDKKRQQSSTNIIRVMKEYK